MQANANSEFDDYDWRKVIEEDQAGLMPKPRSKGVEQMATVLGEMKKEN